MATPIVMPKQGQSVESCIITKWLKKEGDDVKNGDLLYEYETDKASFEEEAQVEGTLLKILYKEGDEVEVLKTVAYIGEQGEDISALLDNDAGTEEVTEDDETKVEEKEAAVRAVTAATAGTAVKEPVSRTGDGVVYISPRAKKLADQNNLDYFSLTGSGPEGRIIERDIQNALVNQKKCTPLAKSIAEKENITLPSAGTGHHGRILANDVLNAGVSGSGDFELNDLSNMRKIIAQRMHESLQSSAQLTLHTSADASNIKALRKELKAKGENITINDMVCHAVVKALQAFPQMNAHFSGTQMKVFKNVHLGIAVDTPRGLLVPNIMNANFLTLSGLANSIKTLANQCQKGNIDPDVLEGGTFTVTNLGAFGIEQFTPVLNTPQIGILGVGNINLKPIETKDGGLGFVPYIGLSLTFDHRAVDGADAARFLIELKDQLNNIKYS